jgi:hypothetical protein
MRIRILLIFSLNFKMPTKNYFKKKLLHITLCRYINIYIIFQRKKVNKKSQNSRNQDFSYYFCLIIEGSGSGSRVGSGSGSLPLINGSGSGSRRPKNMWIRIRIRNTDLNYFRTLSKTNFAPNAKFFSFIGTFMAVLGSQRCWGPIILFKPPNFRKCSIC